MTRQKSVGWDELRDSWLRACWQLAPKTRAIYGDAAQKWAHAAPTGPEKFDQVQLEDWLAGYAGSHTPGGTSMVYRALQQWFGWLAAEGEVVPDPFVRLRPPIVPVQPPPVLTPDQVRALLGTCEGDRSLVGRRDLAILWMLVDCGLRRGELAGLSRADVDLDGMTAVVTGKGSRRRTVAYGPRTAAALDRYLRARGHEDGPLWVDFTGRQPMSYNAVHLMLKRRARQAGVEGVFAHLFRHTFAHAWLAQGGSEGDLMQLTGWASRSMISRYGASAASERAVQAAHARPVSDRY